LTSKTEELKLELEALKYAASMGYPSSMLKDMFAPFTIKRDVALAQPEQEPVAQLECAYGYSQCKALEISQKKRPWGKPWVSLTDEEIESCMEMSIQKTCRAVEQLLKEKNT
jgi:hypothetical protein